MPANLAILIAEKTFAHNLIVFTDASVKIAALKKRIRRDREARIKTLGEWLQTMQDIKALPEYLDED